MHSADETAPVHSQLARPGGRARASGGSCAVNSEPSSGSSRRRTPPPSELDGNEINAGIYAFDAAWLRRRIGALEPSPATGEMYLTDLVELAREDGRLVSAVAFEDDGRFDGINDRAQLAAAEWSLRVRLNEAHMRDGVTMRDPSTVYLDWTVDARRGRDPRAERHPARRDEVGKGAVIGAGSQLVDATVGAGAASSGRASSSRRRSRTARPSGRSATPAGQLVGRGAVGRQLRRAQEQPRSARARSSTTSAISATPGRGGRQHRRRHDHRQLRRHAQAPRRPSATARSSASTRCSSRRVTIGEGARTGAGAVVTKDVPAGKLAVGVPGPHPRAAADPSPTRDDGRRRARDGYRSSSSSSSSS